ncbi:DUF4240 domain-containing protein [Flammeovirga sp. OC4]|uniref:DUF4240 domain-containing protein n=1 Tax=Flammeovirga sp. OC4 TaxID=1382345 RepID=UPI0005C79E57|nr:DUF4240 domain-containing protein [Flammeovirga sp. OC4]
MDTITNDKFWMLIENAIQVSNNDEILKERYIVEELEKLSLEEIKKFEFDFRRYIIQADDFKIIAAQKIIEGFVSDDSYLYFRSWLIGLGKNAFFKILKDPDYLVQFVEEKGIYHWEGLMYVSTEAYSNKTGKEEDETFPRDTAIDLGLDYDFGAPPTKGKDWTMDELPSMLPKLWVKLN